MRLQRPVRRRSLNETLEFAARSEPPLVDRGLPVEILGVWCLAKEMARSRRTGSPLAVGLLSRLVPGDEPHDKALEASIKALKDTVRESDVVAWYGSDSILAVLPDTSGEDAHTALARWRDAMWHRSLRAGGLLWTAVIIEDAASFPDPKAVLRATAQLAAAAPALAA
jgi:hypothetical protein